MLFLSEVSQFILAVFTQWIGIVGGVVTLIIECWERFSKRELHWSTYVRITGTMCVGIAVFLVWRDEYEDKLQLQAELMRIQSLPEQAATTRQQDRPTEALAGMRPEAGKAEQELRLQIEELQRTLRDLNAQKPDD